MIGLRYREDSRKTGLQPPNILVSCDFIGRRNRERILFRLLSVSHPWKTGNQGLNEKNDTNNNCHGATWLSPPLCKAKKAFGRDRAPRRPAGAEVSAFYLFFFATWTCIRVHTVLRRRLSSCINNERTPRASATSARFTSDGAYARAPEPPRVHSRPLPVSPTLSRQSDK